MSLLKRFLFDQPSKTTSTFVNDMTRFLTLLLVASFIPGYISVNVQQGKGLIVESGKSAVLTCNQDESNYFYMYWYQHKQGKGLKLMILSIEANSEDMEDDFKSRWYVKRPSVFNSSLHLNEPEKEDSAMYFCASSMTGGSVAYFGDGTILSVLGEGEEEKDPKVKVFPPNKNEFQVHKLISLVCIATGFFPEHVRLTWYVNGVQKKDLYQNVPTKELDGTYSTSKRLSLTESEYFNPDSTFKCEAAFIGKEDKAVFDEIKGEQNCGVSKESFAMMINQGKISYIMVLFKSAVYALIVLVIIWRKKVLSGSC